MSSKWFPKIKGIDKNMIIRNILLDMTPLLSGLEKNTFFNEQAWGAMNQVYLHFRSLGFVQIFPRKIRFEEHFPKFGNYVHSCKVAHKRKDYIGCKGQPHPFDVSVVT